MAFGLTKFKMLNNTPGTAGGPGGRDRTLAVKSRKTSEKSPFFLKKIKFTQFFFFLHISSSYAKILGETNFRTREIPRSGSKAKDGEKKRKRDKKKTEISTLASLSVSVVLLPTVTDFGCTIL